MIKAASRRTIASPFGRCLHFRFHALGEEVTIFEETDDEAKVRMRIIPMIYVVTAFAFGALKRRDLKRL